MNAFQTDTAKRYWYKQQGQVKPGVSIALAKRLIDAGWAKRILFLCDRKALRKQADIAFNDYTEESLFIQGKR
ncbi:DEAD/DEAH box helicase family protein [Photobacterium leiognathi]|uniref:DEAD/DEAH box helicase family protein n=1 Tax=Photobacterium leiognathi TaxID=553611 RepID=UPI00273751AA|nr:DEAD/DEAH box helicase family protein [Photobacterium leiognathi]